MGKYEPTDSERLANILRVMNNKYFGFTFSAKIVGGRGRLDRLLIAGKIRGEKGNKMVQNGKWKLNASDVLRYARMTYKGIKDEKERDEI